MKRILVTGAGGPAGINFVMSLKIAPEKMFMVGTEADEYFVHLAPVDKKYLVSKASNPKYVDELNKIIEKEKVDFVHAQPDIEVATISENRERLKARVFLPAKETIRICQDKLKSAEKWEKNHVPVAKYLELQDEEDVNKAFKELGTPIWIRARHGAGGRGSTLAQNKETAFSWIKYWKSRRMEWQFIAQEYLPGRNIGFHSLWRNGELITSMARERIEYIYPNLAPSGVTGTPAVQRTIHDKAVNEIGTKAVLAIDPKFNGIACVPPDTTIISPDGGKTIEEVAVGNVIIGANGELTKVKRVLSRNYSGPIFTIRCKGLIPLTITPEHPILTAGRFRRYYRKGGKLRYKWQITEKLWKRPFELIPARGWHGLSNPHDCLLLPKMKATLNKEEEITLIKYIKRPRHFYAHYFGSLKISPQLFKFFGLYLAEGHCEGTSIHLDFGKHEKELIEEAKQIIKDVFNISPRVKLTNTAARIYFCSKILVRFFWDNFGSGARNKRIPEIIMKAPENLVQTFLEYYLKGNGFLQKRKKYLLQRFRTSSKVLALQLQLLFTRLNRFAKIHVRHTRESKINGRRIPSSVLYEVRLLGSMEDMFKRPPIREEYFEDDDYFYIPIISVTKSNYSGPVYNLETENETYLVSNVVVHNCVDLKENKKGVPCVTEINAGRMFTTSFFFSYASKIIRRDYYANIPYLYVKLAFEEETPNIPKYDVLPENIYWIRHIDAPAKLVKDGKVLGEMYR